MTISRRLRSVNPWYSDAPPRKTALKGPEDVARGEDHGRRRKHGQHRAIVERREHHERLGDEPAEPGKPIDPKKITIETAP